MVSKKEDKRNFPAIHEASRLWLPTEDGTYKACVEYLRGLKPGWSLSWLREATPKILNNELSEAALKTAVEHNVPENGQASVWAAVQLLMKFAQEGRWQGVALPHHDVPVGLDLTVRVRPVGMFYSPVREERRLFALQPRLDFAPTYDQDQIWLSALYYEFCCDPLEPLQPSILDLSRQGSGRQLSELTSTQLPILAKEDLDARLDLVAKCFIRAREFVPAAEARPRKEKPTGQIDLFPEKDKG
ncbi:MAG TPA: hypothetical protein VMF58_14860 [Rhizomicrobium sp.]|nr:hypothetical protein [Rhizomicrobium sp.]